MGWSALENAHVLKQPELEYPQGARLTYDDYCRMPARLRYEPVHGDLRMVPSRPRLISARLRQGQGGTARVLRGGELATLQV
ncbi:MAG: hypothetical protein QME87_08520 [Bacillota bacterium]|nr:hypothetical protein [Bacillota bacterium]